MIEKIIGGFGNQKFNSSINNEKVNTSFGSGPLIVYGIPRNWDSDRFVRPKASYRPAPLIKYGVPDPAHSRQSIKPQNEPLIKYGIPAPASPRQFLGPQTTGNEPLIKYGIPDSDNLGFESEDIEEMDEPVVKYGVPADLDEISEEKIDNEVLTEIKLPEKRESAAETPPAQKEKPSYFKRLGLAILGKDC